MPPLSVFLHFKLTITIPKIHAKNYRATKKNPKLSALDLPIFIHDNLRNCPGRIHFLHLRGAKAAKIVLPGSGSTRDRHKKSRVFRTRLFYFRYWKKSLGHRNGLIRAIAGTGAAIDTFFRNLRFLIDHGNGTIRTCFDALGAS
jgi:hypothetical protein